MKHLINQFFYLEKNKYKYFEEDVFYNQELKNYYLEKEKNLIIESSTQFNLIGHTKNLKIPIICFGYGIALGTPQFKDGSFRINYENSVEHDSGKSTKVFWNNKEERNIVFKYIIKNFQQLNNHFSYPIIVRGYINEFKENNYRYQYIDELLKKNYNKIEIYLTPLEIELFLKSYSWDMKKETLKEQLMYVFKNPLSAEKGKILIYLKKDFSFLEKEMENIIITNQL